MSEPLPVNERYALKDICEWPASLPYTHRHQWRRSPDAPWEPGSMQALLARGLVHVTGEHNGLPCYRPTPEGYDRYLADDLEAVNFRKLYPKRRPAALAKGTGEAA